jgi:hypothetical protein
VWLVDVVDVVELAVDVYDEEKGGVVVDVVVVDHRSF